MCLEVKVSSPLFHTLPVEVAVELCSFFSCFLYVLWNLAGFYLLWVLLLHLLQTCTHWCQINWNNYWNQTHPICVLLTEYSLAILCLSLSCNIIEYSACLVGYSFIIRSITSSLRRAVRPEKREHAHITNYTLPVLKYLVSRMMLLPRVHCVSVMTFCSRRYSFSLWDKSLLSRSTQQPGQVSFNTSIVIRMLHQPTPDAMNTSGGQCTNSHASPSTYPCAHVLYMYMHIN